MSQPRFNIRRMPHPARDVNDVFSFLFNIINLINGVIGLITNVIDFIDEVITGETNA